MAFKWDKDMEMMAGRGTLAEFFDLPDRTAFDNQIEGLKEMEPLMRSFDERDKHVNRLILELFERAGCKPDEQIRADVSLGTPTKNNFQSGWTLLTYQPDDPAYCLYRDGKPIAACAFSFRGSYSGEGYIEATKDSFACRDFGDESLNTWVPARDAPYSRKALLTAWGEDEEVLSA